MPRAPPTNARAPVTGMPRAARPAATTTTTITRRTSAAVRPSHAGCGPGADHKGIERMSTCLSWHHALRERAELAAPCTAGGDFQVGPSAGPDPLTGTTAITMSGASGEVFDARSSRASSPGDGERVAEHGSVLAKSPGEMTGTAFFVHFRPGAIAEAGSKCHGPCNAASGTCRRGPLAPWLHHETGSGLTAFQRGAHQVARPVRMRHLPHEPRTVRGRPISFGYASEPGPTGPGVTERFRWLLERSASRATRVGWRGASSRGLICR